MTSGADIFGVVTGVIGLVGACVTAYRKCSPTRAMEELDVALKAADGALAAAPEAGVVVKPLLIENLSNRLFACVFVILSCPLARENNSIADTAIGRCRI
jgi:hypothetical protein